MANRAFQPNAFQSNAFQVGGAGGSFTIDAVLRRTQSASFTIDAIISGGSTVEASFAADAVLRRTQPATLTADAVLRVARSASFTADAVLRVARSGSFTADAFFAYHIEAALTADAVIYKAQTGSFTLRAVIRNDEADEAISTGVTQVHIRVAGVDITDDVIFKDASFISLVNGGVGSCRFRVKDTDRTRSFTTGAEITLDINGVRRWGGYLMQPARAFFFPVEDTVTDITRVARQITLVGVDYNIMFSKRVVRDKGQASNVELREWPAGSRDDVIIRYVFDNYTDLFDDGFTHDGVEHIGFPNPDHSGIVGSGGLYFGDLMREVNRLISGVWYFTPTKDLVFTDVDVPNASKSLSDNPSGGSQIGFRDFSHVASGAKLANDAMVWGSAQGSKRLVFAREQDLDSIDAHGLWQYGEYTAQMYKQASVNQRAASVVNGTPQSKRGGKDDQVSWAVKTFDPAFVIGQKVSIESEVYGLSDVVPIRRMTITFPTKTTPLFDMTLSHEIDEPWNIFEALFPNFDFHIPRIRIGEIDWPHIPFVIDDFEGRTLAASWDVASSGYEWGLATGGVGLQSAVNSGIGFLNLGTTGIVAWQRILRYIEHPAVGGWFGGDFELYNEFSWTRGPTNNTGDFLQFFEGYSDGQEDTSAFGVASNGSIFWTHCVVAHWDRDPALRRIGVTTSPGAAPGAIATIEWSAPLTFTQDVMYGVRWQRIGSTTRARIWDLTAAEPSTWDVEATVTVDFTEPLAFFLHHVASLGSHAIAPIHSTDIIQLVL